MDEIMRKPLYEYILNPDSFDYDKISSESMDIIRENGVRNMIITKKLTELTGVLAKKNIPYVILKGCHLIHEIYPFGIRPLEDIDILIKPLHYKEFDNILKNLSYYECTESMNAWININFSNKMTFVDNSAPKIPIDVHLSLGPYPYLGRLSIEAIFSNTQIIKTDTIFLNVLNNELLLIHLCLHAFSHLHENYMNSCFDIISVIRHNKDKIDWEKFIFIINTYKLSLPIIEVYNLLENLEFHNAIPQDVIDSVSKMRLSRFDRFIFNYAKKDNSNFEKYFVQLISSPNMLKKILLIPSMIYPGRRFLEVHFSGSYLEYVKASFITIQKMLRRSSH